MGGSVHVSNTEFQDNKVGYSARGAGLFIASVSALIENSTFTYNEAYDGAALYSIAPETLVKDSIFYENFLVTSFEVAYLSSFSRSLVTNAKLCLYTIISISSYIHAICIHLGHICFILQGWRRYSGFPYRKLNTELYFSK